jgi:hypothetical protein
MNACPMSASASRSIGGSAGCAGTLDTTEPADCWLAPPTRAMNWLMMSRSSFVIADPSGSVRTTRTGGMWRRFRLGSMVSLTPRGSGPVLFRYLRGRPRRRSGTPLLPVTTGMDQAHRNPFYPSYRVLSRHIFEENLEAIRSRRGKYSDIDTIVI